MIAVDFIAASLPVCSKGCYRYHFDAQRSLDTASV